MTWVRVETTCTDRRIYFMLKERFDELGGMGADPREFDEDESFAEIKDGDEEIIIAEEVAEEDVPPGFA